MPLGPSGDVASHRREQDTHTRCGKQGFSIPCSVTWPLRLQLEVVQVLLRVWLSGPRQGRLQWPAEQSQDTASGTKLELEGTPFLQTFFPVLSYTSAGEFVLGGRA